MKYEKKIGIIIFCFFVFILILGAALKEILSNQYPYPELKVFHQAFSLILSKFVDPIDNELLLQGAEKGLLSSLDPVNLFVPKEKGEFFKEWQKNPVYDCGIRLKRSGRFVYVSFVFPSSAADGEFKIGDIIEEVQNLKYPMADIWELELEMRGQVGKSVKIHYTPADSDISKEVILKIKPYERKSFDLKFEDEYICIKFYEINSDLPKKLKLELKKLPKNSKILIDLRATSSLDYDSASKIADFFIKENYTLIYKEAKGTTKVKIANEEFFPFQNLYILQDEETFGAAEILAMLLKEKGNATIIGTNTYGFTGIPKTYVLSNKSIVYLTSTIVMSEDGLNIMKKGLEPTVEVKKSYFYQETYNKIEETFKELLKEEKKKAA